MIIAFGLPILFSVCGACWIVCYPPPLARKGYVHTPYLEKGGYGDGDGGPDFFGGYDSDDAHADQVPESELPSPRAGFDRAKLPRGVAAPSYRERSPPRAQTSDSEPRKNIIVACVLRRAASQGLLLGTGGSAAEAPPPETGLPLGTGGTPRNPLRQRQDPPSELRARQRVPSARDRNTPRNWGPAMEGAATPQGNFARPNSALGEGTLHSETSDQPAA